MVDEVEHLDKCDIEAEGEDLQPSTYQVLLEQTYKMAGGRPYIWMQSEDGHQIIMLDEKSAVDYVSYTIYLSSGAFPKKIEAKDITDRLRLMGMYDRPVVPVAYRVQAYEDGIELKINNKLSAKITTKGVDVSPHIGRYWSPPHELPLAIPSGEPDCSIEPFLDALGIVDLDDRVLVTGLLLIYIFHKGPYPILVVKGPHGCGKSTFVSSFKSLIDDSTLKTISSIENHRDLFVVAGQNHILSFDNVSDISPKMSDAHCTVATGAQRVERKYYTNSEMISIDVENPQILNGIPMLFQREDFRERSVMLNLPIIETRLTPDEYNATLDATKSAALGHLLRAMCVALRNLPSTATPQGLRMAGAARLVTAAEETFGWEQGRFVDVYKRNQLKCIEESMTEQPLYGVLKRLLRQSNGLVEGSASQILASLEGIASTTDRAVMDEDEWPKAPNVFSRRLERLEGTLSTLGIKVEYSRVSTQRTITITDMNCTALQHTEENQNAA